MKTFLAISAFACAAHAQHHGYAHDYDHSVDHGYGYSGHEYDHDSDVYHGSPDGYHLGFDHGYGHGYDHDEHHEGIGHEEDGYARRHYTSYDERRHEPLYKHRYEHGFEDTVTIPHHGHDTHGHDTHSLYHHMPHSYEPHTEEGYAYGEHAYHTLPHHASHSDHDYYGSEHGLGLHDIRTYSHEWANEAMANTSALIRESGKLRMMRIPQGDGTYKYFMAKKIDPNKPKPASSPMVMHQVGTEGEKIMLGADPLAIINKGLTWFEVASGVGGIIWSMML